MSRRSPGLRPTLMLALTLLLPALAGAVPTAVFPQAPAEAGPPTAIVGASVINVEDGSVIADAVVLIEGDRIKAVGPAGSVTLPAEVRTIRMDGKWLAPGLLNMHVHFGLKLPGPAAQRWPMRTTWRWRFAWPTTRGARYMPA